MKFIVDCMHGKLARKMRIYGYDTAYDSNLEDDVILEVARKEKRTIITSDENLIERALLEGMPVVRAPLDNDLSRMMKIFKACRLKPKLNPENSRCPHCNTILKKIRKTEASGVPERVLKKKRSFYKCPRCGKIYWQGSHWKKIQAFEETLKRRLRTS
ncbi:MAG: Mut7-C RNAse domain-containing protein [Nitrososphaeria archaeon]